ncbi:MAG: uroporphyrinogen decarboxylase family protein [Methanobacteriota archaeon]
MSHITSLDRMMTTLQLKEPDRVPFLCNPSMHAARALGVSLKDYFTSPEHVVSGQLLIRKHLETDAYFSFHYGAVEYEAFGGDVIFREDGPPNSSRPVISNQDQITDVQIPDIENTPCLEQVLETTQRIRKESPGDAPILGISISPISLPVMLMGFEAYLQLMLGDPDRFADLMKITTSFCIKWSQAQVKAGANAIVYFDPVSSPTIIPPALYKETGYQIAKEVIAKVRAPVITAFASGACLPILDLVTETGTIGVIVSEKEDLAEIKNRCQGKITVLGNLSDIAMHRWSIDEARRTVKEAVRKGAPGGGYIMIDSHSEIPLQVPCEVLKTIRDTVHTYGRYPIAIDDT